MSEKDIIQAAKSVTISAQDVANKVKQMLGRDLTPLEIGIVEMQIVTNHAFNTVMQEKQLEMKVLVQLSPKI